MKPPELPPRSSEAYIYDNCEISYELMRKSGEEPATDYAYKGSRVHRVLAGEGGADTLPADEARTFEELWNAFRETLRDWRAGASIEEVWIEEEFEFRDEGRVLFIGHPDKVIQSGSRLFIPDFKTGWHTQDALSATNRQLRSYVALTDANIPGITEITVWIDKPGKRDPPAVFDRAEIAAARRWIIALSGRVTAPEEKKPTRGAWCQYCSGKVICPLWRGEIQRLAQTQDLVEQLPDRELARIAPMLGIAAKVIERLKARLELRVREDPEFFADWRFKSGRVTPEIVSVNKAWLALKQDIDAETFLDATKLGIGAIVEAYRKKTATTWEKAREQVDEKLGENIQYNRSKPTLVYDPKPRAINTGHGDQA